VTDPLAEAVAETLARHHDQVRRWHANEPGAWGFLAGQGILAFRARVGRRLTDAERRHLWTALWAELERTKNR
jgi:hypothetical protein